MQLISSSEEIPRTEMDVSDKGEFCLNCDLKKNSIVHNKCLITNNRIMKMYHLHPHYAAALKGVVDCYFIIYFLGFVYGVQSINAS